MFLFFSILFFPAINTATKQKHIVVIFTNHFQTSQTRAGPILLYEEAFLPVIDLIRQILLCRKNCQH